MKEKKLSAEYGDIWTWIAIDADTKLVPSFVVGNRRARMAQQFMDDLASRLVSRVQISSDALSSYVDAVDMAFGSDLDYGTVVKKFTHTDLNSPATRYSPPDVIRVKKSVVRGNPKFDHFSTSYVEKQNHTLRMHCRRLSRLTNAFSKRRENFEPTPTTTL